MVKVPVGASQIESSSNDHLDSWKEIAAYLKRDVTTVQRWEKREGMPVHRHLHDRIGSVYAFRAELDLWTQTRNPTSLEPRNANPLSTPATAGAEAESPQTGSHAFQRRWARLAALAALFILVAGIALWLRGTEHFWKSPIADARFGTVADFDGVSQAATLSRDGHLVAFLSDRDGPMDVWVTQVGSGEYHNLTHGSFAGLANPSIRTLAFSPDSSLVSFWVRRASGSGGESTGTWAVPTLGGQPRPYLEGVAEFDWSRDGSHLAFHTSASGDPLYVARDGHVAHANLLFTAAPGLHAHFPLWSPDGSFLYFVAGSLPDKLDLWRIAAAGGAPQRITYQNTSIMYPVFLEKRTLLYLATDADGSGPWLYSLDVDRRVPHRLTSEPERYTSLSASADGRQLAATIASQKTTLFHLSGTGSTVNQPTLFPLSTATGRSPRLGANYLLYVSTAGTGESLWKFADGKGTQLWHAAGASILGAPAISPDGSLIAFSVTQDGRSLLNTIQPDGTGARVLCDSLELAGSPAWSPDGRFITTAAQDHGTPHLVRIAVDGSSRAVMEPAFALDPAWSPDNKFVLYSGPDIGTTFPVKSLGTGGAAPQLPALTLTRGARHLAFLQNGKVVVFLWGDIQHKNLWQMDLKTGAERPLTNLPASFNVSDFDISPDGRDIVLERAQERSLVMLLDLPPR